MPATWDDTTVRRQVIKGLRRLADRDQLLEVQFFHGRDAWVQLRLPAGPTVEVPTAWFEPRTVSGERAILTYLRFLERHLTTEGATLRDLTIRQLADRTGLRPDRLQHARHTLLTQ